MDSSLSNFRLERKVSTFAHTLLSFVDCNWNNSCIDYFASNEGGSLARARTFGCTRLNVKHAARNLIIRACPGLLKHISLFLPLDWTLGTLCSDRISAERAQLPEWAFGTPTLPPPHTRRISKRASFQCKPKIASNNTELAFFFQRRCWL